MNHSLYAQSRSSLATVKADSIRRVLDSVGIEDQRFRNRMSIVAEKYGTKSVEMRSLLDSLARTDSLNIQVVGRIFDEYGWIGAGQIGEDANTTLFLVVQHAGIEVQKKYLPILRKAVQEGNAKAGSLALLEDRLMIREGKPQIYGTQVSWNMETNHYYVLPLVDPENVNKRRKLIGMPPIEIYLLECCSLVWDVNAYKKDIHSLKQTQQALILNPN